MSLLAALRADASAETPGTLAPHVGFPRPTQFEQNLLVGPARAQRGEWRMGPEGLELVREPTHGSAFWFPKSRAPLENGIIRFTVRAEPPLNTALLLRVGFAPDDLEALSGYALTLNGSVIRFIRFDDGFARAMGPRVEVPGLLQRREIEVVVTLVGPYLQAHLFDAHSLESLAGLTGVGERYPRGWVGVKADRGVRITRLQAGDADRARSGRPDALVGTRIVRVAKQAASATAGLRALIVGREGDEVFLRATPTELERLTRAGLVPLEVTDQIPWRFVDPHYARARDGDPPDSPFVYKSARMVEAAMRALAEAHPRIARMKSIGKTAAGSDIWALVISRNVAHREREPAILIDGGQHAVELWTTEYVLDIGRELLRRFARDPGARRWVDRLEIWLVPLVNPDGRDAFMEVTHLAGRKNYRDVNGDGVVEPREGVDLNRNFPFAWGRFGERGSRTRPNHGRFRGPEPASEPESRALMQLARDRGFVAALSVHTQGTVVLPPYATLGVKQPRRDEAWAVAEQMVRATPRQLNGRHYRLRRRLYPVDGVWKDWLRHELGTVAMVVEGPLHNPLDLAVIEQSIEESRALWQNLFDRTVLGPVVSGWVENEAGEPLDARVEVVESAPRAGERWRARRSDGFFVRYLVDETPQTLRITASGYAPLIVPVGPGTGLRRFVLAREGAEGAH